MYNLWLIQTGKFRNIQKDDITGLDSLISWNYMGSAEFEFGALPESLHRIVAQYKQYEFVEIKGIKNKNNDTLRLYCKIEDKASAILAAKHLSKNDYGYKEFCGLHSYLTRNGNNEFVTGNFWWDIENDFFIVFGDDKQNMTEIALNKLKEKWLKEN